MTTDPARHGKTYTDNDDFSKVIHHVLVVLRLSVGEMEVLELAIFEAGCKIMNTKGANLT